MESMLESLTREAPRSLAGMDYRKSRGSASPWTNMSFVTVKLMDSNAGPWKFLIRLALPIEYGRRAIICLRFVSGIQTLKES